jgi:tubulin polyglutamylase TTLL6/13
MWCDGAVPPDKLTRMKLWQKINHFPGMYNLARKNYLGKHLNAMRKLFPEEYNFYPQTFNLPYDYNELKA